MGFKYLLIIVCFCIIKNCHSYEYVSNYYRQTSNKQVLNDFSEYMKNVQLKLQKNWCYPDFLEEGHTRVLFKLDRDGNVVSGDILESSGNLVYDESVVNAIHKSEPFGKFPDNTSREYITINYSFDSSLVKTDKMKEYYDLAKKYSYSDRSKALEYINLAISEVQGDSESYFLYKRRAKIKEGVGDHLGAKEDIDRYEQLKSKVDLKRVHALKRRAEVEDSAFAYYHLAYAYEILKDYDNALWAINKAIERTDLNNQYKRYRTELIKYYSEK